MQIQCSLTGKAAGTGITHLTLRVAKLRGVAQPSWASVQIADIPAAHVPNASVYVRIAAGSHSQYWLTNTTSFALATPFVTLSKPKTNRTVQCLDGMRRMFTVYARSGKCNCAERETDN